MSEKMSPQRGLEEQLKEAGNKLVDPPTSVDELLPLLDHVEDLLSRVEQSPAKSMQEAITPLTSAVVLDVFLRHSNVDVKVAVASCISEITRITAPDAPYDDDKMKDVFQLIVSAFEDLSDESSRSYNKRVLILETVAKVRSCVVMLDLECDALIVEMFKLFLANIRNYHPESIFSSMETIMALVLDESEDISSEILTPLLACLKKGNQEILPVAVKLAEKVFEKCAAKLKPYLSEAIKSLDDYTEVVTAVCEGPPATIEHVNENATTNPLVEKNASEAISMEADENDSGPPSPMDADEIVSTPSNSAMANGVSDSGKENLGTGSKVGASVYAREKGQENEPSVDKLVSKSEDDESETPKPLEVESKLEGVDTIRGGKPNSSVNASESSDTSHFNGEKEVKNQLDTQETLGKDSHDSSRKKDAVVVSKSPDTKSPDTEAMENISSPKASDTDAAIIASPSLSESLHDDDRPKKTGRHKKKERSVQEEAPSLDFTTSKKASKVARDSDAKLGRSVKKNPLTKKDILSIDVDTPKNESGGVSDSEKKQMKQPGKKMDKSSNAMDEYSVRKSVDGKRRRKTPLENEATKTSGEDDLEKTPSTKASSKLSKDARSPEEIPRMSSKRKRATSQQKGTEKNLDASLVGTKVKVWWPDDKEFYEGVVHSYDPVKKKHKVLYNDGDEEILLLKKELWEIIDDDLVSSEGHAAETASPEAASGTQKRERGKKSTPKLTVKPGKSDVSLKSGAASSRKGKGAGTKHGHKADEEEEFGDRIQKSGGKNEDDKSKSHSQRTGDKRVDNSSKTPLKSKDAEGSSSKGKSKVDGQKSSSKSKQDTPKTGGKSRPDSAKTGGKSKNQGGDDGNAGKVRNKEKVGDAAKTSKVKLSEMSKVQESEGSTKKRRRAG